MRLGPEWIILILVATCPEVFSLDNCSDVIGFDAATLLEGSNPLETKGVKGISYSIGYTVTDAIIATRSLEPPTQGCKLKTAKIINKSGVARAADAAGAQAAVRSTNFNDPANQQCPGNNDLAHALHRVYFCAASVTYSKCRNGPLRKRLG